MRGIGLPYLQPRQTDPSWKRVILKENAMWKIILNLIKPYHVELGKFKTILHSYINEF